MTSEQQYSQAMAQLELKKENLQAKSGYMKSYVFSVLLPPIGIYYFIRYFFLGDGDDGTRRAGVINLILTIISLIINIWLIFAAFGQISTATLNSNNPNTQFLQELITPANQRSLHQLLQ